MHESLPEDIEKVLKSKDLVLLEHLVKNAGIVDEEFFLKLRQGFPLTGNVGPMGRWMRETWPAPMSEEELAKASTWIRESVIGKYKSAYKQFPVNPRNKKHNAIAVPQGKGLEPLVFFTRVLPFGATARVYYFLRFSEMLKELLLHSLGVLVSSYFDDFPGVTYKQLASVTQFITEKCLEVLGIDYSLKEHKRLPFNTTFKMLGVVVTFPDELGSRILVGNTPVGQVLVH